MDESQVSSSKSRAHRPLTGDCCGVAEETCNTIWLAIGTVFIVATLAAVIVSTIYVSHRDTMHRACFVAAAANVVGGPGEGTSTAVGRIDLDGDKNAIRYTLNVDGIMSGVTSLRIMGPIAPGSLTGPLLGVLCGTATAPASACDVITTPGRVSGVVDKAISNNVVLNGIDVRPVLAAIRRDPQLYYIEVLTNAVPATPGAMRAPLTSMCGWE